MKNCTFFLLIIFSIKLSAQCTPPVGIQLYNNLNGSNVVCPNSSYTLLASPNNVVPYQWTKNGVIVPSTNFVFPYDGNTLTVGDIITCAPASNLSCPSTYTVNFFKTVYATTLSINPSGQILSGTSVTFTGAIPDNHGSTYSYGFFVNGVLQNSYQPTNQRTFSFTTTALSNGDIVYCTTQANVNANPCGYTDTSNLITMSVTGILPVTLSQFNVSAVKDNYLLIWTTASETNLAHFNIQKSNDGLTFTTVGQVAASGNSTSSKQYTFNFQPSSVSNTPTYFRLQMVDKDGTLSYSAIQTAILNASFKVAVSPNPATNFIYVNGTVKQIRLLSMSGQLLHVKNSSVNSNAIDVSSFARGMYLLEVESFNGQRQLQKIILH